MATRRDVVAVASTGPGDALSGFSNRGPHVDLAAPGENIASTWLQPRPVSSDSLELRQGSLPLEPQRYLLRGAAGGGRLPALLQARQREAGPRTAPIP